ncbi:energy transducer TonB [Candidatus Aminicenantes bacterium AC-335-O07]|nr:energy transducer TonB [Candidatus Aminicenantes bacterium AC-335-O07]
MRKTKKLMIFISILFFLSNYLGAIQVIDIKLKLFRGVKESVEKKESRVITSYTLTPFFTGKIIPKSKKMEEEKELKRIFNLKDVELLNEVDLRHDSLMTEKVFQVISINSGNYLIILSPKLIKGGYKFKVEVYEGIKQKPQKNLLNVELTLPRDNIAVIGFSDSKEIPYFLSFRVTRTRPSLVIGAIGLLGEEKSGDKRVRGGVKKGVKGEVKGVVGGVIGGVKKEIEKPLRVGGEIKPPKLIKKVIPIYPKECKEKGIEGIVILEATTDIYGKVEKVKILRPAHPKLNKAAIKAVKQWVYEPYIKDGKPRPGTFTITVSFKLTKEAKKKKKVELV